MSLTLDIIQYKPLCFEAFNHKLIYQNGAVMTKNIRLLALALLQRDDDRFLVENGHDSIKQENFYRPLGGGVEFGEYAEAALHREFAEELGKRIVVQDRVAVIENIFEWEGTPGHEAVFVYRCAFADPADALLQHIPRTDSNPGRTHWKTLAEIEAEGALLHPHQIKAYFR